MVSCRAYCATTYCTEIVSRSFDTGRSRLKIFHHRMLRDRTLLSPSSALPSPSSPRDHFIFLSLHQRSRLALSLILSLLLLFFFLSSSTTFPPLIQSPPPLFLLSKITRQICGSGSFRTQEDSLHLSSSASSFPHPPLERRRQICTAGIRR